MSFQEIGVDKRAASRPTRLACDRCHTQKLRCPRDGKVSGTCIRCRTAGAKCVYSPSSRMGRPGGQSTPGGSRKRRQVALGDLTDSTTEDTYAMSSNHETSENDEDLGSFQVRPIGTSTQHTVSETVRPGEGPPFTSENVLLPQQHQIATPEPMDADWDLGLFSPPEDFGQAIDRLELDFRQHYQQELPPTASPPNSISNTDAAAVAMENSPNNNHPNHTFAATPRRSMPAGDPSNTPDSEVQGIFPWGDYLSFTVLDKEDMATRPMPRSVQRLATPQSDLPPPPADLLEDYIRQLSDLNITLYRHSKSVSEAIACAPGTAADTRPSSPMGMPAVNWSPFQPIPTSSDGGARGCGFAIDETFRASQTLIEILLQLRTKSTPSAFYVPNGSPPSFQQPFDDPQSSRRSTTYSHCSSSTSSVFSASSPSANDSLSDEPPGSSSISLDSSTLLLVLTCYIRLLHIYDSLFSVLYNYISEPQLSFSDLQLPGLRIGSFCASSCSTLQVLLFVQVVAHMLDRISKAIQSVFSPPDHCFGSQDCNIGGTSGGGGSGRLSNDVAEPVLKHVRQQEMNLKRNMGRVKAFLRDSMAT